MSAATAAEQLRRLLDLVPRVADGEPHRLADLARRAGVPPRELLRDLRALAERYDVPGGWVEPLEVSVGADTVEVRTQHFLRPMRLTAPELRALELGLAMLAGERPPEEQAAVAGARARLRAVLAELPDAAGGAPAPADAAAGALDAEQRQVLAAVRAARRAGRRLRMAYRKPGAAAAAERVVCPYALVAARGAWYVVAGDAAGLRIFRADRIAAASLDDAPCAVPPDFRVEDVVRDGRAFVAPGPGEPLVVRYSPVVARWIAERERGAWGDDGSFIVEHPLADVGWAVRHVLQYGREAEVLAPAAVREAVRARAEAMAGALGAAPDGAADGAG